MRKILIGLILTIFDNNNMDTSLASNNDLEDIANDTYVDFIDWIITGYQVNRVQAKSLAHSLNLRYYYELDDESRKLLSKIAHEMRKTSKLKIAK